MNSLELIPKILQYPKWIAKSIVKNKSRKLYLASFGDLGGQKC